MVSHVLIEKMQPLDASGEVRRLVVVRRQARL